MDLVLENKTSITIVEDDASFRNSVNELVNSANDLVCECSFKDAASFLKALPELKSKIYWLDISLPDGSGIDLIKMIKSSHQDSSCIICSLHDDDEHIFQALKAGADGYILKNAGADKMLDSIYELIRGGSPMSPYIARKVMQSFRSPAPENVPLENLSARETEILQLIATGLLYKEVAVKLFISPETVKKHIRNIYSKLQVQNRTEAVIKFLNKK